MKKKYFIKSRVTEEQKEQVKKFSEKESRTESSLIMWALKKVGVFKK